MHQLRSDVDGLYELTSRMDREAKKTDSVVRDIDLRLRRLEKTSGRQFGLLIATQRQHGHRLDRVESILENVAVQVNQLSTQMNELAPLPAQFSQLAARVNQLETRFDKLETRFDQLEARIDKLETRFDRLETRFDQLETRVGQLEGRMTLLEAAVNQNSRTLDVVVELLRKQQSGARGDEG